MEIFFPPKILLQGKIRIPSSKSHMQRVLAAVFLSAFANPHWENITIYFPAYSKDALQLLTLLIDAGLIITEQNKEYLCIKNQRLEKLYTVNCGESGLFLRMFSLILSLQNIPFTLHGQATLNQRKIDDLVSFLQQSHLQAQSANGYLPLQVSGTLQPGDFSYTTLESSQYLSGLLMSLPLLAAPSHVAVQTIKSRPYLAMTMATLRDFGVVIEEKEPNHFFIPTQLYQPPKNITIEADWSAAAFWMVGALIAGKNVVVEGLSPTSLQADRQIVTLLQNLSLPAGTFFWDEKECLHLTAPDTLPSFTFDATHCPDLFPALALLAAFSQGESQIIGVHRLHNKESDRAKSIAAQLQALQIPHFFRQDALHIQGVQSVQGARLSSFGDHRMAMLAALFSLRCEKGIIVDDFSVVNKSYPQFLEDYFRLTV